MTQEVGDEKEMDENTILQVKHSNVSDICDSLNNLNEGPSNPASDGSSDDEDVQRTKVRKRVKRFSASDSDSGKENTQNAQTSEVDSEFQIHISTGSDNESVPDTKSKPFKSRIQLRNPSDSEDSDNNKYNTLKNEEQQLRMKNKRNKLRNKFKSLMTARGKEPSHNGEDKVKRRNSVSSPSESDDDIGSIEKIKQKMKERMSFRPSICDPDTSDEENTQQRPNKQKNERKIMKSTSPKPLRMSAKQAMENMQKIKSESNRMLREKEVSLPYHRPKALCLKDIMNRRKPALTPDGKALPIKMNEQQLKQYAQMLEERQKEMMELCKSESEEEDATDIINKPNNQPTANENKETNSAELVTNKSEEIASTSNINVNSSTDNNKSGEGHEIRENLSIYDTELTSKEQDSESSMLLVYNESANSDNGKLVLKEDVENKSENEIKKSDGDSENRAVVEKQQMTDLNINTEDSQLISLHLDSEQSNAINTEELTVTEINKETNSEIDIKLVNDSKNQGMDIDNFSDDEINIGDIDSIIENAEIIKDIEDRVNSQILIRNKPLNTNPKLTGAPGMVIDLEVNDAAPRKSGMELLKERFTYFSKLKTPEELEREKEKNIKPGAQLKKLKQELEDKISEQRSLEWAKRLEEEEQQQKELRVLRGEESDDDIDKLDKIEAQIEDKENVEEDENSESEAEEEPIENDIEIKDKERPRNAMVDDEAEESEGEEQDVDEQDGIQDDQNDGDDDRNENDDDENDSESDESESSEDEQPSIAKKGRILKAFEDSDDEDATSREPVEEIKDRKENEENIDSSEKFKGQIVSQDEELQLAQRHKSASDDLFISQDSALALQAKDKSMDTSDSNEGLTQTFSILESSKQGTIEDLNSSGKLSAVSDTQALDVSNVDKSLICPMTDSQKDLPLPSQMPMTLVSQTQAIGEDLLALCTGQFYNNEFVSQVQDDQLSLGASLEYDNCEARQEKSDLSPTNHMKENEVNDMTNSVEIAKENPTKDSKETDNFIELNITNKENVKAVDDNLKSILDELDDPEFESPKPNRFFTGGKNRQKEQNDSEVKDNDNQVKDLVKEHDSLVKKKFIIESDDETNPEATDGKKRKKLKKKKAEKRALQISDDEEELSEQEEISDVSDIEEENPDRLVEYDSEENEIEIKPQNPKKKRKTTEFFENEAELTSEDEWIGSGDEDEAGLDRMEREEGDDDTFNQGTLQRELGQIHMRDVLDQDKREVRIIQELLFEDGDLGTGGRQRKFRWKNIDGEVEIGTVPDEFADTQEEEFESEEQWRKQRHEREMFLRQMRNQEDPEESLNVSVNRTSIIKANLSFKAKSSSLLEVNNTNVENIEITEKKTARDIPSPKKPFVLMQQSYQGSLLSRGRGALARLAALATPLAADDDAKVACLGPTNRRNFVFAAITPDEQPKITKRKAESNPGTPKLVKKMRIDDKNTPKNSILDHLKV